MPERAPSTRIAAACVVGTAVLWGTSFLGARIAVEGMTPSIVTFARCAIAALALGAWAALPGTRRRRAGERPAGRAWLGWAIACGAATGAAFLLIAIGMEHATSSTAGITMATVPAWTMLIAGVAGVDRIGPRQLAAIAIGSTAVATLAAESGGGLALQGTIALLLAAIAHGAANVLAQRSMTRHDPALVGAAVLAAAALVTLPGALADPGTATPTTSAIAATVLLGLLPSAGAAILMMHAIDVLGAARTSLANYLVPPVGIAAGVLALGEQPDATTLVALTLATIALSVGLSDRIGPRRQQPARVTTG